MLKYFFVLVFSFLSLRAAEPLVAYKDSTSWHFIDSDGKTMFSSNKITNLSGYGSGLFCVEMEIDKAKKWVYLDKKGNIKFAPKADGAYAFTNGLAVVYNITQKQMDDRLFGMIDTNGKIIVPIKYMDIKEHSEGKAYVMNKEERGIIDRKGKFLFQMHPGIVGYQYYEGLCAVSNQDYQVGFMDSLGNVVIPFRYDEPSKFSYGLAKVASQGKFGYINKNGVLEISLVFDEGQPFYEDMTFVGRFDANMSIDWALMNRKGAILTDYRFKNVTHFNEGLACVKLGGNWGFVNKNAEFAIDNSYSFCYLFQDGLAWAAKVSKEEYGFIDKIGNYKVKLPKAQKYFDLRHNIELATQK